MGPEPEATTPPRPEAAPQEEGTRPAATTEASATEPGIEVRPSPAELAAEGTAATAEAAAPEAAEVVEVAAPEAVEVAAPEATEAAAPEAAETAAPEVAEVASSAAPLAEEEEPEVVLGRSLLPSTAELEAKRLRLSDWEVRLGDRINSVSARYAEERAKVAQGHGLLQEELEQARVREAAALQREIEARRRETEALEGLIAVEEMKQAVADRDRVARELAAQARKASAAIEAEKSALADLAAAAAKKEEWLAAREAEEEREAVLREREAKVEELLAERGASTDRITRWVGTVNPLLESLGANPIWVTGAPSPLSAALQVLDTTAERLRDVEANIQDLLETEGREVAREVAEYIVTSFRSHDPAIQLTPVLVGPLLATVAAARERVLEAAGMVAARLRRRPEPAEGGSASGPPEQ
ncbi:auxilin-related protein 2-like [Panicum hallii]|uniref:auxilin-related protein 2-like n=1 Tax=Panicum hallii TaxID=206008 RepID=UPI000DF4F0C9|nr:auxilin-related protein 2-like [Panicum hallii]